MRDASLDDEREKRCSNSIISAWLLEEISDFYPGDIAGISFADHYVLTMMAEVETLINMLE
jgi:hypothetical protein